MKEKEDGAPYKMFDVFLIILIDHIYINCSWSCKRWPTFNLKLGNGLSPILERERTTFLNIVTSLIFFSDWFYFFSDQLNLFNDHIFLIH